MAALCRDAATPNDAQLLDRPRQVADDEAAFGLPERFAFRQAANVAPAFGHDVAAMSEISMPIPARRFSRGRRTFLHPPARALDAPLVLDMSQAEEEISRRHGIGDAVVADRAEVVAPGAGGKIVVRLER